MRLAIIDLGTNSVRFDVREIRKDRPPEVIHTEKLMVRLGQGVFVSRRLDPVAARRTLESFRRFHQISKLLSVSKTVALGTSALREARNGQKLVDRICAETGIALTVISGSEEAQLIAKGVLAFEPRLKKLNQVLLVDIGGGSTEIAYCKKGKLFWSTSLELGAARIQQLFLKTIPPHSDAIQSARNYIREMLMEKLSETKKWNRLVWVGSSGTIRAVVRLIRKRTGRKKVTARDVHELTAFLSKLSEKEIRNLPGVEPKRTDLIFAGSLILDEMLRTLKGKEIDVSEFSLRDGVASEEWEVFRKSLRARGSLHREDWILTAAKFGQDPKKLKRSILILNDLLKVVGRNLKIPSRWRMLLEAAVLLRRSGLFIGFRDHPKHSAYLAKHLSLPGLEEEDREKVALLCEWHRDEEVNLRERIPTLKAREWDPFLRCLSILRIVESLDDHAAKKCEIVSAVQTRTQLKIRYRIQPGHDLGLLRVDRLRKLFEKKYQKSLVVERV